MAHETILDEIDRLLVVYDKAKEYLTKISSAIDEQNDAWQHRRKIIQEQTKSASSFDFLLPKTQRINELSIDAVQALCRVDLLTEQILRIDPKALNQTRLSSFSARITEPVRQPAVKLSTIHPQESASNGKILGQSTTYPVPVLRAQTTTTSANLSTRSSVSSNQEHARFVPIDQYQSTLLTSTTPKPTPLHPQMNNTRPMASSSLARTSQSDHSLSPMGLQSRNLLTSMAYQPIQEKVKVKLQRIDPGTKWRQAKIEVIDSLSAFYVENLDPRIHEKFEQMFTDLHDHYDAIELSGQLKPLDGVSIGDFGVARFSADNRWYRARLLTAEEDNHIRIVYIDYGNIETKYIDEFFPLERIFASLPAQAVACSLSKAFPRTSTSNNENSIWPEETTNIFRDEIAEKIVEVTFEPYEDGTESWPLSFVNIIVDNQTVVNSLSLKQRIEPRPNRFIAEQLSSSLSSQEYILFNIPVGEDEVYSKN